MKFLRKAHWWEWPLMILCLAILAAAIGYSVPIAKAGVPLRQRIVQHHHKNSLDGGILYLASSETSSSNAGIVTIVADALIASTSMGTVKTGDVFFATGNIRVQKGAAAGMTELHIYKSGTAGVVIRSGRNTMYQPVNDNSYLSTIAIVNITSPGTLTMNILGSSSGSDGTIAAGNGIIAVRSFLIQ